MFAWDIGGAHVKFACATEGGVLSAVRQWACPIWRADGVARLEEVLREAVREYAADDKACHAVVMTAELADCFVSRADGVRALLAVLREALPGRRLFYTCDGFIDEETAAGDPLRVASVNWHATAAYVAARLPYAVLMDVGGTTTDVVAVGEGAPICEACDDAGRLLSGELVYSGAVRTPLMAMGPDLNGEPLIAEQFAVAADVYRVLGDLPEGADLYETCDRRDKTSEASARRIARMFGRDYEPAGDAGDAGEFGRDEILFGAWRSVAEAFAARQCAMMTKACERAIARLASDAPLVGAGVGRFIVRRIARETGREYRDFAELLNAAGEVAEAGATCAPAASLPFLAMSDDGRDG